MVRPILIDEADGKCEICLGWHELNPAGSKVRHCVVCHEAVNSLQEMQGNGYQSPRPDHFHLKATLGLNGREAIFSELCFKCYCDTYERAYGRPYPPTLVAETTPILV